MGAISTEFETARDETLDELLAAARAGDADRIVACFADDAEMVTVHGVYRGKEAIAAYWRWMCAERSDADFREIGLGRLACGDTVIREVIESGRTAGVHYEVPIMGCYTFDEAGRIRRLAAYSDTWAVAKQIAAQSHGVQGLIFRSVVGMLDKASSRGRPTSTTASPS